VTFRLLYSAILFLGFISINNCFSQKTDSILARKYGVLFEEHEYGDVNLAKKYVDSAVYFALRSDNAQLIGRSYQYMGWYYQDRAIYSKANNYFFKSLAFFRKAKLDQGIADAYGNIGNAYFDMGEYQKSLDFQLLSLEQNEKIIKRKPKGYKHHMALQGETYALHNIGSIYSAIGMYDKALEYERKSVPYELKSGNTEGVAISYTMFAYLFNKLNQVDSAEYYYKKSLKLTSSTKDRDNYSTALQGYATMEKSSLSREEKGVMLKEALWIRRDLRDKNGEGQILLDICETQFNALSKDSLSKLFQSINTLLNSTYELDFLKSRYYRLYSKYASRIGDYDNAYFSLENFVELKALSDEKQRAQDLIAGDIKQQLQNKNFNDSIQFENDFAIERAEYHEEISKIQNVVYLSVIGFIIVVVSLFIFINSNRRKRKLNELLSEKNELIQVQKSIVEEKNQSISDSISYAQRLQLAILPTTEEFNNYFPNSFLFFRPKDVVSGDFYWFEVKGDVVFVAVADCTGHGVPGAMMSVVCSDAISRAINEFKLDQPNQILDKTRELVIHKFEKSNENVSDGMDISLVAIDLKTKQLTFSGANNPLCIVRENIDHSSEKYALIEFKGDKQPIGRYAHLNPFTQHQFQLEKGDVLYLFSDGFADQFGGKEGKKFKYLPFKRELIKMQNLSMDEQRVRLENLFADWRGNLEQIDDVCIMGIKM
jgi:serine phosphatase RsbU (regulator of sigma subunit)